MAKMATQRAVVAARIVIVAPRAAVIDDEHGTAHERRGERCDPRPQQRTELRHVLDRPLRREPSELPDQIRGRRAVGLDECTVGRACDAALPQRTRMDRKASKRQRVPLHWRAPRRRTGHLAVSRAIPHAPRAAPAARRGRALARAQFRADLEDAITPGQRSDLRQRGQHVGGHAPGTGSEFEHIPATGRVQHLGALPGETGEYSAEISGAVTKSPSAPNFTLPAL